MLRSQCHLWLKPSRRSTRPSDSRHLRTHSIRLLSHFNIHCTRPDRGWKYRNLFTEDFRNGSGEEELQKGDF